MWKNVLTHCLMIHHVSCNDFCTVHKIEKGAFTSHALAKKTLKMDIP